MNRIDITNIEVLSKEPRGYFNKDWIRLNKKYLVKYNDDIYPDQDIMEKIAMLIHHELGVNTVNVNLIKHDIKGNGCMVENFLEEPSEVLIEIDDRMSLIRSDKVNMDISKSFWHVYKKFDVIANENSQETNDLRKSYHKMIMADCLTNNEDRYLRNVGIVYDEKTKQSRLSPSYDNGLSFSSFPSNREVNCVVANEVFEAKDVMKYLYQYHLDDIKDVVTNYKNNFSNILGKVKLYENMLSTEKYEHIVEHLVGNYSFIENLMTNEKETSKKR